MPCSRFRRRDSRGAVAVEMALVLPILIAIVFGIIDFAAAFNAHIQLSQAAQAGARIAAIGAPYTTTDVSNRAMAASPAIMGAAGSMSVTSTLCAGDPSKSATVTVSVPYRLLVPLFPGSNFTMNQKAVMPCAG